MSFLIKNSHSFSWKGFKSLFANSPNVNSTNELNSGIKNSDFSTVKSGASNSGNNNQSNSWANVLTERWFRIFLISIVVIVSFLLLNFIGSRLVFIFFTVLPLFIGYALASATKPIQFFFQKYFSPFVAKILATFIFSFFILVVTIGLFVLFIFQLEGLWNKLINTGSESAQSSDIRKLLARFYLNSGEDNYLRSANIESIKLVSANQTSGATKYTLTVNTIISVDPLSAGDKTKTLKATYVAKEIGNFYTLIFWFISGNNWFKSVGIEIIQFAYNLGHKGWGENLAANYQIIFGVLYLIFFSLVIMIFAIFEPPRKFFSQIWKFIVRGQSKKVSEELKVQLQKKLKGWSWGLLIDQLYILIGTALVIFLVGAIYRNNNLLSNAITLALFMAFFNLIPYIGPWIGGVVIGGVTLSEVASTNFNDFANWLPFIFVILGILVIQIGESLLVAPTVYSATVNLSPIAVIMVLLIFGALFGFWLMPFAIPILLIIQTVSSVVYSWKWKL